MAQITTLPTPPSRQSPATFSERSDAFLGALPTFVAEANALAGEVNSNAATANTAAQTAVNAAATAEAFGTSEVWQSGKSYAVGEVVWSPVDFQIYRRKTAGSSITDPSADPDNWRGTSATKATLTRSFVAGEEALIEFSTPTDTPVVSVTKETPQIGISEFRWDVPVNTFDSDSGLSLGSDSISLAGAYTSLFSQGAWATSNIVANYYAKGTPLDNGNVLVNFGNPSDNNYWYWCIVDADLNIVVSYQQAYERTNNRHYIYDEAGNPAMFLFRETKFEMFDRADGAVLGQLTLSTGIPNGYGGQAGGFFGNGNIFTHYYNASFGRNECAVCSKTGTLLSSIQIPYSPGTSKRRSASFVRLGDGSWGILLYAHADNYLYYRTVGEDGTLLTTETATGITKGTPPSSDDCCCSFSDNQGGGYVAMELTAGSVSIFHITENLTITDLGTIQALGSTFTCIVDYANDIVLFGGSSSSSSSTTRYVKGIKISTRGSLFYGTYSAYLASYRIGIVCAGKGKIYAMESSKTKTVSFFSYSPTNQYVPAVTNMSGRISTQFWTDLNSMAPDETLNGQYVSYAISVDGKQTFKIVQASSGERNIVRDNGGTWEYNSHASYGSETWTAASVNAMETALKEAMAVSANLLTGANLSALSDAEQFSLGDTLDVAVMLKTTSSASTPTVQGIHLDYDAATKEVAAVHGTDYEWSQSDDSSVVIKSLVTNNLKVRVV